MPSPWFRRAILALSAVVIVIAAAVAALPYFASTRIVRDRIAWEMSAWSGFRVAIAGAPKIEVWPQFRAILTDVTLSQWTDADAPPVMKAERVEINLSALAALRGDVIFTAATLIRPTLRVERTDKGLYLPALPTGGRISRAIDAARTLVSANPAKPDEGKLASDAFGSVEFRDGRIVTPVKGKASELVTSLTGQVNWSALNSGASFTTTGIWRGESVSLDLSSQKPLLLFAGAPEPLSIAFKAAPANLYFEGTGAFSGKSYFDGQTKFSAPSLRRVLEWIGVGVPPGTAIGAVAFTSKINGNATRMKFSEAQIALDKNPGMGALDFSFAEARPLIAGTLAFDTLDLRAFLSAFTPLASPGSRVNNEPDTSFSDWLNLDLRLSAAHANVGATQLTDVAATAQVKDGLSAFDVSDASAFGGNIQASLRFDRKPDGTQSEIRFLASDINGAAFAAAAGMTRLVPSGTGSVSLILKGPGKAWQSILENASGSVTASFGPGTLSGLNLPAFMKHAQDGGFFPLDAVANGTLPIDGAELKATISNGVARIEKLEAHSPKYKVWLSGIVPYSSRGLALSGGVIQQAPLATDQNGQTASKQIGPDEASFFVGGTWSTPFVSPVTERRPLQ
jgi:AsmA protein